MAESQPTPPATNSQAFGVTSMVTGILSLVLVWVPVINFILSVVAIVFGILGIRKPASKGMSIAGLATGGVALIVTFIMGLFWIAVFLSAASTSTY